VAGGGLLERRFGFSAGLEPVGAARMKTAASGRIDRVRYVAFQDDALPAHPRVRRGYGGHQRLGIRMARVGIKVPIGGQLHDFAQIHYGDSVAYILNDRQVVGNDDIGKGEFLLQVNEQVDDLGADAHVQS